MKKFLFGLMVVLLLIGAVACAGGAATNEVYSGSRDGGNNQAAVPTTTRPYGTTPPPIVITSAPSGEEDSTYYGSATIIDRMVIYNAYLTIVVDDVSVVMDQITDLAKNNGGFVVNSSIGEDQNRLYAYISFRVLSTKFDETLQALHNIATDVKSEQTTGQDVTEEYTDLASKLRNLEASEAQLLELMERAGTIEEILAVQKELVSTREQIEVTKGRMQYLEQSSDLALFTVTLEQSKLVVDFYADTRTINAGSSVQFFPNITGGFSPYSYEWDFGDGETSLESSPAHAYSSDGTYTVTLKVTDDEGNIEEYTRQDYINVLAGWNAGSIADSAWNGLVGFGHVLAAFFIGLGIFSPVWIVILLILYFAWWRRRKRKV
jgi:molybdopterin converting factor small subunit